MKNKTLLSIAAFASLMLITSCNQKSTADSDQAEKTKVLLAEANRQVGMPNIVNFQQRKTLKNIYELCDQEDLICYAYLQNGYTGKLVYIGQCVGYGIPFSAQYTNPETIVNAEDFINTVNAYNIETLPQADPNGLFMPTSSSATWLLMVDPETSKPRPVYFEPTIVVSPFKLDNAVE